MPRKPIVRSREHFYHLTARSNNREDFYLPKNEVWGIFSTELVRLQLEIELEVAAFVLMDNHFHLLARCREADIDRAMFLLMKRVSQRIRKEACRINHVFGGRYKGCLITDYCYLLNAFKYVVRNPVAAGLVERVQEYPFSIFDGHRRQSFISLRVVSREYVLGGRQIGDAHFFDWLDESYASQEISSIKRGISKSIFQFPKQNSTGKPLAIPDLNMAKCLRKSKLAPS